MKPVAFKSAQAQRDVHARYGQALADWPAAYEERRIATAWGETFALVSGPTTAPPLILLHGAQSNALSWAFDVATWAADHRVYAVDIIGDAGRSAAVRPPLDSDQHARWLDEVLDGLGVARAVFVGISLGGWLTLDYAIRRPERVAAMALLCPGGVGRQRLSFMFKVLPLLLLGHWGQRKARELVLGTSMAAPATPAEERVGAFLLRVIASARPRFQRLPRFSDADLAKIGVPTQVFLGARDVLFDSSDTRARFATHVPHAEIHWLPEVGHYIRGQTAAIHAFVRQLSV